MHFCLQLLSFYLKTHLHEVMIMVYVDGQTMYKYTLYNNNSRKRENGAKFLYTNEIKLVWIITILLQLKMLIVISRATTKCSKYTAKGTTKEWK